MTNRPGKLCFELLLSAQLCLRIGSPVPFRKPVDEQRFFLMVSSEWASFGAKLCRPATRV
jgi:hypothetical protein